MAKISNKRIYETVTPTGGDYLIGTDAEDLNRTKNFKIQAIADFVGQNVTIGVGSLNTLTGPISLIGGDGLTVTDDGAETITISMDRPDYIESLNGLIGNVDIVGSTNITVTDNGSDTITVDTQNLAKTNEANTFVNNQTMTRDLSVGGSAFNVDHTNARVAINRLSASTALDVLGDTVIEGDTGNVLTLKSISLVGENYILFKNSSDSNKGWVGYKGASNILQIDNLISDIELSSLTGAVKLSLGASVKLQTKATGVDVNGEVSADSHVTNGGTSSQFVKGDGSLDSTDYAGDIAAEQAARIAADNILQGNIDDEESARIAADNTLQDNIDSEATTRANADTTLQDNIDSEETARIAADNTLQGNIDAEATTRANADTALQGNINAEAATRLANDNTLQGNIDAEESARISADSSLQGQITNNDTDISNLDTRLTTAEGDITSEESARIAADNTLQDNIDDEESARIAADTALDNAKQDISEKNQANGYAPLDSGAKIPIANLPDSVVGQVEYQGTWNASTDTPTLPAASGVKGHYYVVSVGGTYETIVYAVGDWIISNGTAWEKVDNTDAVTSVFTRIGPIIAIEDDYDEFYPLKGTTISAGTGLIGGGDLSANRTISHDDTSSQGSVNNSGLTFIQDVTLDPFGHVTGLGSATVTLPTVNDTTITLSAGTGLTGGGDFTTNQSGVETITFNNSDRGSSQNIFKNISVSGQSTIVADSNNDTLTFAAGSNVTLTTNATNDTITINSSFTETDTLDSVTDRGNTTTNAITVGNTNINGSVTINGGDLQLVGADTDSKIILYRNYSSNAVGAQFLNQSGTSVIDFNANTGTIISTGAITGGGITSTGEISLISSSNAFLNLSRLTSGNASRVRFQTNQTDDFEVGLIGGVSGFHITDGNVNPLLTITSSGNVGIGTDNPAFTVGNKGLHIADATSPAIRLQDTNNANSDFTIYSPDGVNELRIYHENTAKDLFKISSSTATFDVNTTINGIIRASNTSAVAEMQLLSPNGYGSLIYFGESGIGDRGILGFAAGSGDLVYRSGASTLSSGTERMRIDSSGRVGIGTDNPSARLQAVGPVQQQIRFGTSTSVYTDLWMGTGFTVFDSIGGSSGAFDFRDNGSSRLFIDSSGNVLINSGVYLSWGTNGASSIEGSTVSNKLQFRTNSTDAMIIDSSQRVGIGTDSPDALLHVKNSTSEVGEAQVNLEGRVGGYGTGIQFTSQLTGGSVAQMAKIVADGSNSWNTTPSTQDARLTFHTTEGGVSGERMRIDSSGNVGIGITPTRKLDVNGVIGIRDGSLTGGGGVELSSLAGFGAAFQASNYKFMNAANSSEYMRIDSSGNVTISTGSLTTGAPSGSTARPIKIGDITPCPEDVYIIDSANALRVDINGTLYYLALADPIYQ